MNKFLLSSLATAGLVAASAASNATAVTYALLTSATPYTTTTGATPGTVPTMTNDSGITAEFTSPTDQNVAFGASATGSTFGLGNALTTSGAGTTNTTATWTSVPLSFQFDLDTKTTITGAAHTLTVNGNINGHAGYDGSDLRFSDGKITYTSFVDSTSSVTGFASTDPTDSAPALELQTSIDGVQVAIWIDTTTNIQQPGTSATVSAFIETTPEPGSVAMIVGMGVSGGIFLRRKRRA